MTSPVPRGRIGDPGMTLGTDPRADPRMVAELARFGVLGHADPAPMDRRAGREQLLGFVAAAEEGFEGMFAALAEPWKPVDGVRHEVRSITGDGGHTIALHIHRPEGGTAGSTASCSRCWPRSTTRGRATSGRPPAGPRA
jgi:acetyl esterase